MSAPKMSGLSAAVTVLASLIARFPELPAVDVHVSTIFPDQVELSAHNDLAAFEAWREALGIDPWAVVHKVQSRGTTRVLDAHAVFTGVRLRLVGYAEIPTLVAGVGVAS
ncbi:hypothetical protein F2B00_32235 [Streptomyces parvus]|uniref:hypothetical protein n=1 Tax=Streptomyces parvus TaxID=66428 RepID=UPI001238A683|nr:hypothetical protein [Streptomyces parvus]KAA6198224.1 hypothetical protein F2B00_32235 [Streptomyces parvus]GGS25855.1 hypothetical protein GCM10010221_23730 [Streptomyces parvus]